MAFRGSFDHTLDAKNRLTIPAKLRRLLAEGAVVALQRDAEECIAIWCTADFDAYVDGLLDGIHPLSEDYGNIERFFNAYSAEIELDAAGRVMIPRHLLEKTGLGRDVVVVGARNRLEVWDREAWKREDAVLSSAVREIGPRSSNDHTA
jgi:transcriptional regulator MraZ